MKASKLDALAGAGCMVFLFLALVAGCIWLMNVIVNQLKALLG